MRVNLLCVLLVTSFSRFYCQQCVLKDDELDAFADDDSSNGEQTILENRIMKAVLKNAAAELDRLSPLGVLKNAADGVREDAVAGVDTVLRVAKAVAAGLDEAASKSIGVVNIVAEELHQIEKDHEAGVVNVLTNSIIGLDEGAPLTKSILDEVADGLDELMNMNGIASRVNELITKATVGFQEALPVTFGAGVFAVTDELDEVLGTVSFELDVVFEQIEADVDALMTDLAAGINRVLREAADRLDDEAAAAAPRRLGLFGEIAAAVGEVVENVDSTGRRRRFDLGVLRQVGDDLHELGKIAIRDSANLVEHAVAGVEGAFKIAVDEVNDALKIVAGGADVALKIVVGGAGGALKITSGLLDEALEVTAGGLDVALKIAAGFGQAVSNGFVCSPAKWLGCAPAYAIAYAKCSLTPSDIDFASCVLFDIGPGCRPCLTPFSNFVQDCEIVSRIIPTPVGNN